MERIWLTRKEKRVLRALRGGDGLPLGCELELFLLEEKGMVRTARAEGGVIVAARLTLYGRAYLRLNPKLRNPLLSDQSLLLIAVLALSAVTLALSVKLAVRAGIFAH